MIRKLLFCILFAYPLSIFSQEFDSWKVYPSYSTISGISASDDKIYSATLGGIFAIQDGEVINKITTMEGLYRSNPTSIIYDKENGRVVAGYIDGTIDVINTETLDIERLEDIKRTNQFSKSINTFQIYEGRLYVATSFGIVIYNNNNSLLVEDTYSNFGTFDSKIPVNGFDVTEDSIYVATTQGVAVGAHNDNLVASTSWTTHDETDGLPSNVVQDIIYYDSSIYTLIDGSVYKMQNGIWEASTIFPANEINRIEKNSNSETLGAATDDSIIMIDTQSNDLVVNPTMQSFITEFSLNGDQINVGTSNEGVIVFDEVAADPINFLPSGPYLNFFSKTLTDEDVFLATSTNAFPGPDPLNTIRGYYIYSNGTWNNFNRNINSELNSFNSVYSVGMNDSSYYFGSWGSGVVKHNKSSDEITVYNRSNSDLYGISENPNYVVISGLDSDVDNNMWAVSYLSDFPLNVQLNGTEEWIPFTRLSGNDEYFNLFVDSFDKKWISLITSSNAGSGLLVVDTGDPEDPNDDQAVKLTSSENNGNLPDEKINAIIQDKNDEIWIGTARGIARFIFPELIIDGGPQERSAQWLISEDTTAVSRFLLRDVNVTAMAVNDANQKWIGSENQGLWLLNEEGSRIEKRFTAENSPLISDNIKSISIDNQTGEVFVATELGLVSFQDIPNAPVRKLGELKVFPNPFQYSRHNQIIVEGLSEVTRIKILGVDGTVVNEMDTQGGRISWDGYDYNGNRLGTGVYFIIAYEDSGSERGIGKVVIVK